MITLTRNEIEILVHRLEFLSNPDDTQDLYEGTDYDHEEVSSCAQAFLADLVGGSLALDPRTPAEVEAFCEAIEGSTFISGVSDEAEAGRITRQKLSAFRAALESLQAKAESLREAYP